MRHCWSRKRRRISESHQQPREQLGLREPGYERMRLSNYITDTKIEYSHLYTQLHHCFIITGAQSLQLARPDTHRITSAQPAAGAHIGKLAVV